MRRATGCWHGKMHDDPIPSLKEAVDFLLGPDKYTSDVDEIMALSELPEDARNLVELAIRPNPGSDELHEALMLVVDPDKLIEIHYGMDGYEGIWHIEEYSTIEIGKEDYHLLKKQ